MFSHFFRPKPCLVCLEKDKRIEDLKEHLKKQMSLHEKMVSPAYSYAISDQANLALEGAGQTEDLELPKTEDQVKRMSAVEKEVVALLTATY